MNNLDTVKVKEEPLDEETVQANEPATGQIGRTIKKEEDSSFSNAQVS